LPFFRIVEAEHCLRPTLSALLSNHVKSMFVWHTISRKQNSTMCLSTFWEGSGAGFFSEIPRGHPPLEIPGSTG
jgi:hypothetical protein